MWFPRVWTVSFSLARSRLTCATGECVANGSADVTVAGLGNPNAANTIAKRFDRTLNGGATAAQRWGIPNVLRVVTRERIPTATLPSLASARTKAKKF